MTQNDLLDTLPEAIVEYLGNLNLLERETILQLFNSQPQLVEEMYSAMNTIAGLLIHTVHGNFNEQNEVFNEFIISIDTLHSSTMDMCKLYLESEDLLNGYIEEYQLDDKEFSSHMNNLRNNLYSFFSTVKAKERRSKFYFVE